MADKTEIAWTDSTFNPWWGCTKIAPGCDHCYAAALDKRTGGNHWQNQPRVMSDAYWRRPTSWNKQAKETGKRHLVFCGSMCDWADKNAPKTERNRLWQVIKNTPQLTWQLLTKRAANIGKFLPEDWRDGYPNVWLGVTVEDKKHGLKRLARLKEIPAVMRFISVEPLLEDLGEINLSGIGWVIVGGESGPGARPMLPQWVDKLYSQCDQQNVPFFFKQWGARSSKGGDQFHGNPLKQWPERYVTTLT